MWKFILRNSGWFEFDYFLLAFRCIFLNPTAFRPLRHLRSLGISNSFGINRFRISEQCSGTLNPTCSIRGASRSGNGSRSKILGHADIHSQD